MNKYYCDRCKVEIVDEEILRSRHEITKTSLPFGKTKFERKEVKVDLCDGCSSELFNFIYGLAKR